MMNIVYIIADDLGFADVGYHDSDLHTPNINSLAAEATTLSRFYAHPVCTASRVSIVGGIYPHKAGLSDDVIRPWTLSACLPLSRNTIADSLKTRGYLTSLIGKWHLGHGTRAMLPSQRGFDYFFGLYGGSADYWTAKRFGEIDLHVNNSPTTPRAYLTEEFGDHAVDVVSHHDFDQPLFMMVAFNAPHLPLQARQVDVDYFSGLIEDNNRKIYAGQVLNLDRQVGRIIQAIKDAGQWDRTMVVFTTDNGGDIRTDSVAGNNRPLRGGKSQLWEGGIRAPAILHYPGLSIKSTDKPLHVLDLHKTALDVAGSSDPSDGKNLLEVITGNEKTRYRLLHYDSVSWAVLMNNNYKYVKNPARLWNKPTPEEIQVYDIRDVGEQQDISSSIDLSWVPLFEAARQVERITPQVTPDRIRPDNFIPFSRWTPPA